jgi:hypothetical protein
MSDSLTPWHQRAVEEANLLNPAFCATLLTKTTEEYIKKNDRAMPFALSFLLLPVILHQATREALPSTTITSLLPWVEEHGQQLIDFGTRVQRLRPFTREALIFGIARQTLGISKEGGLVVGAKRVTVTERRTQFFTTEARECVERAGFVGRWFSAAGTTATIYSAWGVRP